MDTPLTAADAATRAVAPLWPLKHFVAVNPYLGMTEKPVSEALAEMARLSGARPTLERSFYAKAIAKGRITQADIATAIAASGTPDVTPEAVIDAAGADDTAPVPLATFADLAKASHGTDWPRHVTDTISAFLASYFDHAQARLPHGETGSLYAAWHQEAALDTGAEIAGLKNARSVFAALPDTAEDMIAQAAQMIGLDGRAWERYCQRLVLSMPGWSGYTRYLLWQAELHGGTSTAARDLLAIRLAWEVALRPLVSYADAEDVVAGLTTRQGAHWTIDLILQSAFELGWQRDLAAKFAAPAQTDISQTTARPSLQAAFCIDVRSEVFRRALETVDPAAETIGFAGFFGAAISYTPLGRPNSGDQCPVLLTPAYTIAETAGDPGTGATRQAALRSSTAWGSFKQAAVSSFGYVETLGLGFAGKLAAQALGAKGSALSVRDAGLSEDSAATLAPTLAPKDDGTGIPQSDRLALAKGILAGMSLDPAKLARVVILAGHGSTSANNPHATGLDCGACGGHTGEANARVAVAILNDPGVRAGLAAEGTPMPEDTVFVAALHNTTTDAVTLYDTAPLMGTHGAEIDALEDKLAAAGALARAERAPTMATSADAVTARAQDWSQVRPEWGLAGCAAFIAAPRHRSAGRDLSGRAFLHSYEWGKDDGFGVLELIMTAPLVVESWINLQYYGSTVDNRVLGAGNKVLHNAVCGDLGVIEGNAGDLRPGLPWQSVHDGETYVHEPLRLNAVIEAPVEAMNDVIARHAGLRDLVDNGWVHLFQMDEDGRIAKRYTGKGRWEALGGNDPVMANAA